MSHWKRSRASGRGHERSRLACALLILSLLLPAGVINAEDPPGSTKEPPPTPATLPAETVTPHMTEDGRVVVIVFLKEQPLHEISPEVRAEYEAQFEALQAQIRAQVPEPWEGEPLTEDEEKEAVRAAPELTTAQQDELDALHTQMDALDTEMRREMLDRAQPRLAASQEDLVQAIEELGGQILYRYTILNGVAAAIPPEGRAAIEARPDVAEVVDDQRMTGHLNVSVPTIDAATWWAAGYTGGAYDVAVVDSGIDNNHPGLSAQAFCESRCLAAAGNPWWDPTVDDVNGHGTHVAGIVASTNGTYRGVAYGLDRVFNCKAAYDTDGSDGGTASMYWSDGMSCVDWALISNTTCGDYADTINLSYGGSTSLDDTAYARFWDAVVDDLGIAATISAGNSGPGANTIENPSIAYNVMCVANMDDQDTTSRGDDTIRTSSSRGPTAGGRKKPDITAPGTNIYSANNTWETEIDWVSMSGTSMAAPHVAGALLLMTEYHGWRPMVQKAILINTADDWGDPDWDSTYGWGYIDLWEAEFNKADWFQTAISPRPDYDFYYGYLYADEKATLVWHRRAAYAGASYPGTYYDLSDLDLLLYQEDTGALIDYSTATIDNVEQVQSNGNYYVVIKVDAYSSSFDGTSTETYALATEEAFSAASGPAFSVGTSNYSRCVGNQWTVNVTVNNTGDLNAHSVLASLTIPTGLSLVSGSNPQSLGTITSGAGKTASWVLQANQAGSYSLPVNVSSGSYGESFSASGSFSVNVSAIPSVPSLYTPANGSSTCDTTPTFDWSDVSGVDYYHIQVDDSSSFLTPVIDGGIASSIYTPASSLAAGTYYWRVRAHNSCGYGSWSTVRTFTVLVPPSTAPSLYTPGNGSSTCDPTPDFDWSAVSGATSYQIQVDNNSTFSSPEINVTTGSSSYTPSSALAPGTYYWRVRGSNTCGDGPWSAVRTFTILAPPPAPSLLTPSNGSSTCDITPTFEWSAVGGATSYQIQVDNNSTFSSPEINVTTGSPNYTPGLALAPGTYYWRVRAANTCGYGSWSAVRTFTVVVPPSSAPSLNTPGNGSSTCDTTPTFEWSAVSGATSYRLQVDDDPGFGSPEIDTTTASPNYTPGSALAPGTYYWRVRGANTCGDGPWSAAWTFTVVVPPSSAPGLITPSNGSSTCDTTPGFAWSAVSGATSYQIQVDDDPGFGSPEIDTTTASPNYTPGSAMPAGTYYWRVRGSNICDNGPWSAVWSLTIMTSPSAPGLVAPANGSSTCDTTPTFDWSAVSGATFYQIQADNDPGFGSPEIDTTSATSEFTPGAALPPGNYYWRVRGANTCGYGSWSADWSVSVVVLPLAPNLILPANGASTTDTTPDLDWSSVSGATSYQLQVANNPAFAPTEIDTTTTDSEYVPTSPLSLGWHYWRVRGSNSCGDGSWSTVYEYWIITRLYLPVIMRGYP